MNKQWISLTFLSLLLLLGLPTAGLGWPLSGQWITLTKDGALLQDPNGDANGARNVVSDATHAAAFTFNDGAYLYFRMRVDDYPLTTGGNLKQWGWGVLIDTDQNADNYEWLIMADGIRTPEGVRLEENLVKGDLGDPSDGAENYLAEYPVIGNVQAWPADTSLNGDPDYFLDFRIPYEVFKATVGLTDDSLIRLMFGSSSSSANSLTDSGADLVGGATLYDGLGDFITPTGAPASSLTGADGVVRYVEDIDGFGDRTLVTVGQTIYVRVDDLDQTFEVNPGRTVNVTLTTAGGDIEKITLDHTGVAGKFTGTIVTAAGGVATRDGTLQVSAGETVTVTYVDVLTAGGGAPAERTDTLLVTSTGTDLAVTKNVDILVPAEGDLVTFTLAVDNLGPNNASGIIVRDLLPTGLSYASDDGGGSYDPASGDWTVGALTVNSQATLTIAANVDAGTGGSTLSNAAALIGLDQTDEIPTNNAAAATLTVGGTDLEITKAVDNDAPGEGDTIIFDLEVKNYGPSDATGISVRDLLPPGLSYVSHTGGTYAPASGDWNIGAMAVGSRSKLRIRASVDAGTIGTTVTNIAEIIALDQADADPGNNSASRQVRIGYLDLAVTQTASPLAPVAGGPVRFTITVTNPSATQTATGVLVNDLLPPTLSHVSDDSGGSYDTLSGDWSVGPLAAGASASLTIDATTGAGTAGQSIINTAALVDLDQIDENPANNSDSTTLKVDGTDLALAITVSNPIPAPAEQIVYTLTVTNNGPATASGVEITDFLPVGVTYVKNSAVPSQGSYNANAKTWNVGSLAIGGSATLTLDVTVDAGTSGQTIINNGFITAADQDDPDASNNIASVAVAVSGTDLNLAKSVDNASPGIGVPFTYTLTLTNEGPRDASGITVKDLLPAELEYISHLVTGPQTYDVASGLWQVGSLLNGATATLQITCKVKADADKLVINNFSEILAADQGDPDPTDDTADVDIFVNACDIAVLKTVDNATPEVGDTVTYTLTVSNESGSTATGLEIEDFQPVGVTFASTVPSQGSYAAGIWDVGSLAVGSMATMTVTATVNAGTAGSTIVNEAALHSLDQTDAASGNNLAQAAIAPIFVPDPLISMIKSSQVITDPINGSSNPKAIPGAEILYTITATNSGGGTTDSDSIVLVDAIDSSLDLFVDDLGGGSAVLFIDGASASGLTLAPGNISYSGDGSTYSSTVFPDAAGYDPAVRFLRITPSGALNASDGFSHPNFTLRFKMRIK